MTDVYLHGILAQEYGKVFRFNINKPKDTLQAIEANKEGFIGRITQLQREGFFYDIIVDKQRVSSMAQLEMNGAGRIDIVPAIVGSAFLGLAGAMSGGFWVNVFVSVGLAALSYALTPKPDLGMEPQQQLTATASAARQSYIFGTHINTAQQGTPVPLGYGRLKVGSAVIQSSMKSFPTVVASSNAVGRDPTNEEDWGKVDDVARVFRR
jgi:predicted phage tail protein